MQGYKFSWQVCRPPHENTMYNAMEKRLLSCEVKWGGRGVMISGIKLRRISVSLVEKHTKQETNSGKV